MEAGALDLEDSGTYVSLALTIVTMGVAALDFLRVIMTRAPAENRLLGARNHLLVLTCAPATTSAAILVSRLWPAMVTLDDVQVASRALWTYAYALHAMHELRGFEGFGSRDEGVEFVGRLLDESARRARALGLDEAPCCWCFRRRFMPSSGWLHRNVILVEYHLLVNALLIVARQICVGLGVWHGSLIYGGVDAGTYADAWLEATGAIASCLGFVGAVMLSRLVRDLSLGASAATHRARLAIVIVWLFIDAIVQRLPMTLLVWWREHGSFVRTVEFFLIQVGCHRGFIPPFTLLPAWPWGGARGQEALRLVDLVQSPAEWHTTLAQRWGGKQINSSASFALDVAAGGEIGLSVNISFGVQFGRPGEAADMSSSSPPSEPAQHAPAAAEQVTAHPASARQAPAAAENVTTVPIYLEPPVRAAV